MKNNWKKEYSLQEISLDKDFYEAVGKNVREKIKSDMQKGNIIMNSKNKRRTAIICAAAAALLSVSAIGIHAAASTDFWQEIKVWINGEEITASMSKTDDDEFYIAVEDEAGTEDCVRSEQFDVIAVDALDMEFYTECDSKNRLWLKAHEDADFAVDITDELVKNGSYSVNCIFGNGCTKVITVEGTLKDNTITVSPIETEISPITDTTLE